MTALLRKPAQFFWELRNQLTKMVALDPPVVKAIPLDEVIGKIKCVPINGDTVQTARDIGICFGD